MTSTVSITLLLILRKRLLVLRMKAQNENIGAKVLSSRLAKVLKLLTTLLTIRLFNATEHIPKSRVIKRRTIKR